jgi:hypothetical protein
MAAVDPDALSPVSMSNAVVGTQCFGPEAGRLDVFETG